MQPPSCRDAGDPQAAQIALAVPPVAVRIPQAFQHSLVRPPAQSMAGPKLAFSYLEYFFVMPVTVRSGLTSSHSSHSCEPLSASNFSLGGTLLLVARTQQPQ